MMSIEGVGNFDEIPEKFAGIKEHDPKSLGYLAFYLSSYQIKNDILLADDLWLHNNVDWETAVSGVIYDVRSWKNGNGGQLSRFELAKKVEARYRGVKEVHDLLEAVGKCDALTGLAKVLEYIEERGFTVRNHYAPSPLFPDGREEKASVSVYVDDIDKLYSLKDAFICDEDGHELDPGILEYLRESRPTQRSVELVQEALSEVGQIDSEVFEELRHRYGAKAAALLCFKSKVDFINKRLETAPSAREIRIPEFELVGTEVFEAWKNCDGAFDDMCEQLRQRAIALGLKNGTYLSSQLTIIRSSAVKSEDGESNTGAGIYQSVAVSPEDKEAFRDAICQVYASCSSPAALLYQKHIGVSDEQMGLVIQPYLEHVENGRSHTHYGHINSRGANPNIVELHTEHGDLLYDKATVASHLMVGYRGEIAEGDLHTHPDHNNEVMRYAVHSLGDLAHVAVLAEYLFGGPMQLEFVDKQIVQVRPLVGVEAPGKVTFPEGIPALFEMAGVGVGDMELEMLPEYGNNSDRRGFIVVGQEYGFTIDNTYGAFPKEGAVVILSPSSSGHVQAHCREKGLMCLYVKGGTEANHDMRGAFNSLKEGETLRFVTDGYKGNIY